VHKEAHLTQVLQNNDTACVATEATTGFGPAGSSLGKCVKTSKRRSVRNYNLFLPNHVAIPIVKQPILFYNNTICVTLLTANVTGNEPMAI